MTMQRQTPSSQCFSSKALPIKKGNSMNLHSLYRNRVRSAAQLNAPLNYGGFCLASCASKFSYDPFQDQLMAADPLLGVMRPKTKKSVSFAPTATVTYRPQITKEEIDQSWYSREEYASFESDRRCTILTVRRARGDVSVLDSERFTVAGLEQQLSAKQTLARKYKNMHFIQMVLEQQYVQRRLGISDPETLQAVAALYSKPSSQNAHLAAILNSALDL